ncbi:MAG TPA: PIN domain-containing protein [bacterium]|mgnify:CR=1 FL=1|nr:PIN domain-containing protein [bacterium]
MKMVIDTSAIISVITNEAHKDALIDITKNAFLITPESMHAEIGNAFSAMLRRKRISIDMALKAIRSYEKIPIQFDSIDLENSLRIAGQLNIYAYDAYFIDCAERNRSPLLSIDEGLIGAAKEYGLQIIEV